MKAVQVLLDDELIRALDSEAKRTKTDRSKVIRTAAARYLQEVRRQAQELQHRRGYERGPQEPDEVEAWQDIQAWPET